MLIQKTVFQDAKVPRSVLIPEEYDLWNKIETKEKLPNKFYEGMVALISKQHKDSGMKSGISDQFSS